MLTIAFVKKSKFNKIQLKKSVLFLFYFGIWQDKNHFLHANKEEFHSSK